MKTYDLAEARNFAADLDAPRWTVATTVKAWSVPSLDAALIHYASLCCNYLDGVRQWGRRSSPAG